MCVVSVCPCLFARFSVLSVFCPRHHHIVALFVHDPCCRILGVVLLCACLAVCLLLIHVATRIAFDVVLENYDFLFVCAHPDYRGCRFDCPLSCACVCVLMCWCLSCCHFAFGFSLLAVCDCPPRIRCAVYMHVNDRPLLGSFLCICLA